MKNFNNPIVSVIIATYNREKYIKRAIESVLDQTYKNIELIIIDDGSIDKTEDIVWPYLVDSRVYYIYQENKGVSLARNNAIKVSKGEYIAILDSDDFWCYKKKLEKQVNFLEKNKEYVLVGGGAIRINEEAKELTRCLFLEADKKNRKRILFSNVFVHSTVVFRKSAWGLVGGYDKKLSFSEDWDLFFKLGRLGKFYNFQEYFVYYLQGKQNISNLNIRSNLKLNINLRKKYCRDYPNFWKALFLSRFHYFCSFLPFKKQFYLVSSKLKKIILGY